MLLFLISVSESQGHAATVWFTTITDVEVPYLSKCQKRCIVLIKNRCGKAAKDKSDHVITRRDETSLAHSMFIPAANFFFLCPGIINEQQMFLAQSSYCALPIQFTKRNIRTVLWCRLFMTVFFSFFHCSYNAAELLQLSFFPPFVFEMDQHGYFYSFHRKVPKFTRVAHYRQNTCPPKDLLLPRATLVNLIYWALWMYYEKYQRYECFCKLLNTWKQER